VLFPQLQGKCQGKTHKDGARPVLFLIFVLFYVFLCCSMYFCFVLCIFVLFYVWFVLCRSLYCVCICVLYYCHRVATQLQLNISYHIQQKPKLCAQCACLTNGHILLN